MANALLQAAMKAVPRLAKHLPKLWPLLLEAKNRERVTEALSQIGNASPSKRLKGQIDLTAVLAETYREQAETDEETRRATDWATRARKLRLRVDVPQSDRARRREQRASVRAQLAELQREIDEALQA